MKTVFATVGKIGSGKDTLANIIGRIMGATVYSISDEVRAEAFQNGIAPGRVALSEFSNRMLVEHGEDYFASKVIEKIDLSDDEFAVVSAVRTPPNVALFGGRYSPRFYLFSIIVDDDCLRYSRVIGRAGDLDRLSQDEFRRNDESQEELFRLSLTMSMAYLEIDNSGSFSDLELAVEKDLLGPIFGDDFVRSRKAGLRLGGWK